jgi:hypothetical protein
MDDDVLRRTSMRLRKATIQDCYDILSTLKGSFPLLPLDILFPPHPSSILHNTKY